MAQRTRVAALDGASAQTAVAQRAVALRPTTRLSDVRPCDRFGLRGVGRRLRVLCKEGKAHRGELGDLLGAEQSIPAVDLIVRAGRITPSPAS
ncbi:MAG: hypothetical protein ACLSVD_14010 [Eggerthellaceae bacterium]